MATRGTADYHGWLIGRGRRGDTHIFYECLWEFMSCLILTLQSVVLLLEGCEVGGINLNLDQQVIKHLLFGHVCRVVVSSEDG